MKEVEAPNNASFRDIGLQRHYDSDSDGGLLQTYERLVGLSERYDRFTGYFSSSIYAAVELMLGDAWRQPGKKMRMICSPQLSREDVEAIETGYSLREASSSSLLETLDELWLRSEEANLGVQALAALVALGQLDIKIAIPTRGQGMYHSKMGLCGDSQGNWVYFHGSANETFQGFALNWETLDLKFSWGSEDDRSDIEHWQQRFEDAWNNRLDRFDVVEFPEVAKQRLIQYHQDEPEAIAEELKRILKRNGRRIEPSPKGLPPLFDYQENVLKNWRENSFQGIIDHVTGAGKTITALSAIKEHCAQGLPSLILVPRDGLQKQWIAEIGQYLGASVSVLPVGGALGAGARTWSRDLPRFTSPDRGLGGRIVVAVVKTATGEEFRKKIRVGGHLLVVADEVHNMGAPNARTVLDLLRPCTSRLGLSATYQRANDDIGTKSIEEFFGDVLRPGFSISDAISRDRLVPYYYDFEICHLSDDEDHLFSSLTQRINSLREKQDEQSQTILKTLLSRRARVVKSAVDKVSVATQVFSKHYSPADRWLVYCDNLVQLDAVYEALSTAGFPCAKYFAEMSGDKEETLEYLALPGRVVISIKCLDEGINIPEVDKALILASSTNPREYIQRRGRVLRKSKGKTRATIIDVLVLDANGTPALRSEVDRMKSFISDSLNKSPQLKLASFLTGEGLISFVDDFEEEESYE